MRWADWIWHLFSSQPHPFRRRARLKVQSLEDRSVPHAHLGDLPVEPETGPVDVVVVKEELPPEAVVEHDDGSIHVDEGLIFHTMNGLPPEEAVQGAPTNKPNAPRPQLGDRIWRDQNGNGFQDSGEPGVAFVKVDLYQGDTLVGSTTSDWLGNYAFNVWNTHNGTIDPDDNGFKSNTTYQIRIAGDQPALAGLKPTQANQGSGHADEQRDSDLTTTASGGVIEFTTGTADLYTHLDAGFVQTATISDVVWFDRNNNGRRDRNEQGLANVTVRLLESDGVTEVATTTTGPDGSYTFTGLMPGDYMVEVGASNFTTGGALKGYAVANGKPGQIGPVEGSVVNVVWVDGAAQGKPFNILGGKTSKATTFGFFQAATLSGRVFLDPNRNGHQDPNETAGVGKVRIRVAGLAGVTLAMTDDQGNFHLDNMPAGAYSVMIAPQPGGYRGTTPRMVLTQLTAGQTSTVKFGQEALVDLKVTQSASSRIVSAGSIVTLTYRVKNMGMRDATGVSLFAPLPGGLKYLNHEAIGATYDPATQRATVDPLISGAEVVIKVRVRVLRAGAYRLIATAQSLEQEATLGNNRAVVVLNTPASVSRPAVVPGWMFGSSYR